MQKQGSKYFASIPLTLSLGAGYKGQNQLFSEQGHFAYQIKRTHECSSMVATIFPSDLHTTAPPPDHGNGTISQMSCLLTKIKRINVAVW